MDRRRTDAECGGGGGGGGGRVVHRHSRTSKLTVVVVLQNLLVAACLIVTLYVHRGSEPEVNTFIKFLPISGIDGNTTLELKTFSQSKMDLIRNNTIFIKCTGPYVLYMYACYKSLDGQEATGELQLQVVERVTPVASVVMNASSQDVCRGLHSIAYLRNKDQASLRLLSAEGFKLKNVTVGLSYLLGTWCEN